MHSLKIRLTLIISIISILIFGAISYINYNKASSILMNQIQSAATDSAEHNGQIIDEWLLGIKKEIEVLSQTEVVQSLESKRYMPIIKGIAKKQKDYDMIYVVDSSGNGDTTTGAAVNIADRPYFMEAMASGKSVISEPIISRATNEQVIAIGTPIFRAGEIIGFVGASATLSHLQELVQDMKLNGYGYGLIQGTDMTTIAHPDVKWLGTKDIVSAGDESLTKIFERMSYGETGYGEYYFGVGKVMAFAPINTTGWSIAQTADMSDIMAPLADMRQSILMMTIIGLLMMIVISVFIANFVAKPLVKLSDIANLVAQGDLTQKADINDKSEIGMLASAFNEMIQNLKDMAFVLRDKSTSLASSAQQLSANAEETSAGANETASTIVEVSSTVEQTAQNAQTIKDTAEATATEAEKGRDGIQMVTGQMQNISSSAQGVAEAINNLNHTSGKVGVIVQTITDIADQTNLLALNAAIEAARAGDQGRGFAVVAEEVRKLAEQSARAAQEIQQLIASVQTESKQASEAMGLGASEVQKGVNIVDDVGQVFAGIINKVNGLAEQIEEIASGTEQVSTAVQSVASTTEEVTAAMEEMASSTETLNEMAEELQNMAARFKVDNTSKAIALSKNKINPEDGEMYD